MNNNPGKKAPWIVREQESRAIALQQFLDDKLPAIRHLAPEPQR